ncbi:hypothetical protein K7432_013420 [Basidiobolus ranarum]|uniref:Uncharacterized protein n=1 Tax=Basidiobolus ranarum TaxID=34480 RepID=A0ABR2WJ72_9FUNG
MMALTVLGSGTPLLISLMFEEVQKINATLLKSETETPAEEEEKESEEEEVEEKEEVKKEE